MAEFKVGDVVSWTSQSAGIVKTKRGKVVEVVRSGLKPAKHGIYNAGRARPHESYVVQVWNVAGDRARFYWPRVSQISLVTTPVVALQATANPTLVFNEEKGS